MAVRRVGIIGWRGMVGLVLLERMSAEHDFDRVEPVFFSTSQAGAPGPDVGQHGAAARRQRRDGVRRPRRRDLLPGRRLHEGDPPRLRAAGWTGYWIDAASTLRMAGGRLIVLDPVNRAVIDAGLANGVKNYIGGNCTVSLMLMAMAGLFGRAGRVDDSDDLPGRLRRRRPAHARAGDADGRRTPASRRCSPTRRRDPRDRSPVTTTRGALPDQALRRARSPAA